MRIEHQEFPWDIGIWSNICEGMGGSRNPIVWFWPFARSPTVESGLSFEHNEIDDPNKPWPPPDPDRMFRASPTSLNGDGFTQNIDVDSFRQRQQADLARRREDADGEYVVRRRPFYERMEEISRQEHRNVYENEDPVVVYDDDDDTDDDEGEKGRYSGDNGGEEAWRNKEGERLADFGVDEVAEFYDEDDLPLAELMRRRKTAPQT